MQQWGAGEDEGIASKKTGESILALLAENCGA